MSARRSFPAAALAWLVLLASPAAAHGAEEVDASNYRTRVLSVRPQVAGLEARAVDGGTRLELTNRTGNAAIVAGYDGEPYLRVGPDGVFENRLSPATYVNRTRDGDTPVPREAASAPAGALPDWRKVSDGHTARWHDRRAHWMGREHPPEVAAAPGRRHVIDGGWTVPVRLGARSIAVRGDLVWIPGPSPLPWLLVALALVGLAVVAARRRSWAPALAALTALVVVVDVVHAGGTALAASGSTSSRLGKAVSGSSLSVVAWAVGVWAAVALIRRRPEGVYGAMLTGFVVALVGGLGDVTHLARSQVPFHGGADLARAVIAVSLGAGVGLVAGGLVALRRHVPDSHASAPEAARDTAVSSA